MTELSCVTRRLQKIIIWTEALASSLHKATYLVNLVLPSQMCRLLCFMSYVRTCSIVYLLFIYLSVCLSVLVGLKQSRCACQLG